MKRTLLLCFITIFGILHADIVGKITFLMGTIEYREDENSSWITADFDMEIDKNSSLKIGFDSEVEISWNDFKETTQINEEKVISVQSLLKSMANTATWDNKLKAKLAVLVEKNDNESPDAVAAIRKSEVEIKQKTDLAWKKEIKPDIDDAIKAFQVGDYLTAINHFSRILNYDPLSNQGHIARSYLTLCYYQTANQQEAKKHFKALKEDFPHSEFIKVIESGLNEN